MAEQLYPFRFKPVYKDYVWGGDRIIRRYGRSEPPGIYAESWEIADHPDGMSVLENGPLAGLTLHELVQRLGPALLGQGHPAPAFPLILKLIDARERLSVQVHPDEATARRYGGNPKTEMWYVLEADPGAGVYAGLNPGVDRAGLQRALESRNLESVLRFIPLTAGQAVFVPAGRLHAIDAGCLLLEIQQRSNTTYRLYDWNRIGADGRPRALHVEQALRAIRGDDDKPALLLPPPAELHGANERRLVMQAPFFTVEHWRLAGRQSFAAEDDGATFHALFVVAGRLRVEAGRGSEELETGNSCLVPADLGRGAWLPESGPAEVLCVTGP
ncbi:MAG: class I mannose-6-phosphate isomerase [Verrucomicrobia bacterium]|nr:class I mannose-6-phosphate isomerase [Verrucomicrobiota bacterium]